MRRSLGKPLLASVLCVTLGCTYLHRRAGDALEVADVGLAFSKRPYLSCFMIFPPIHLSPIGAGAVDGWFAGLGGGTVWSPYYERSIGLLLWGEETLAFGKSRADLQGLDADELREQATHYRTGPIGLIQGPLPTNDYAVACPHYLHVGWIGVVATPRYSEILDFLLGWSTVDISFDDKSRGK
jgi:hypothetical protein